ncbi:PhzF family phenazine biosynthesis protein [Hydrogenophaga sp. A37]|uniref:PhzF family phenazine biosynthesis protein n=1 Tax=Hydrogenophaga sp. A37 TaxID=1945864 RepID=UPI000984432C|nr:PhzF family phenazine biosynthesis protein [Hydrogenophaga sp. A37]OOG82414.1 phenazine biosynthesis protein PhzF [Hydrogenophaga sp. A37]
MSIEFVHVDVFSPEPYSGNSLAVFPDARGLSAAQMLRITQELRHFEAIFLEPTADRQSVRTRVFDLFEELPFAGHPIIGAAAVLHRESRGSDAQVRRVMLSAKTVTIVTERTERGYYGLLDQGTPEFLGTVQDRASIAKAFNLQPGDLRDDLPLEVVSTGLRYLVVPLRPGALERAGIPSDISELLRGFGAQFAVLLDEAALEVRHWNNDGIIEDVATGSAAGSVGAYRLKHGLARAGETFLLHQGRFNGRPSQLRIQTEGNREAPKSVKVGGDVAFVGRGTLEVLP